MVVVVVVVIVVVVIRVVKVVVVVRVVKVVVVVGVVGVILTSLYYSTPLPLTPSPSLINKPLHDITIRINTSVAHEWPMGSITVRLLRININYHHFFIVM